MSSSGKRAAPPLNGNNVPHKIRKENGSMSPGRLNQNISNDEQDCEVAVVGAGPAGLMLATNLVRFGIKTTILDDRPDATSTGRADGLQPKTLETLKQMRLGGELLDRGAKFYDLCFWSSEPGVSLRRTAREAHYPPETDLSDPYMVLAHQGMVEQVFLDELSSRGVEVCRNAAFVSYENTPGQARNLRVTYQNPISGEQRSLNADYLVGCDGAHSQVRKSVPGAQAEGASSDAIWGVLDGELDTNFPDIWHKTVVYSHIYGNILFIPRERNMTRLYIELKSEDGERLPKDKATQQYVMKRAKQMMEPYVVDWKSIEWFGIYQIGQRVANRFSDDASRVFIAGDASHTHSPKAAQGMNTSMHDTFNLAWKLNLKIRGLARENLLDTYEHERRKIAQDLINFDFEHANAFHDGDSEALKQNFFNNIRFISGAGADYDNNLLNPLSSSKSIVQPGRLPPPAKVTRYVDANPVDLQLDIPMLGQFRMYFICPYVKKVQAFLHDVCKSISTSLVSDTATRSYAKRPRTTNEADEYIRPERYLTVSHLFTSALVTATSKHELEFDDLPEMLQKARWTIYNDDRAMENKGGKLAYQRWIGDLADTEVAIMNVRPDGYVGSVKTWDAAEGSAADAAAWVEEYYKSFVRM